VRAAVASNRTAALRSPLLFEVSARGFQIDRSSEQSAATENQDVHGVALSFSRAILLEEVEESSSAP
jgi:hypothetical protein